MSSTIDQQHSHAVISEVGRKYLQLHLTPEVGPVRLRGLLEKLGNLEAVLDASISEMQQVSGIGSTTAERIFASRRHDLVEHEVERAKACGVRIVCMEDKDYPKPLLNIPDPPICLYIRGQMLPTDCVAIAIVGTRRCSHYGREQAIRFSQLLAGCGFTVVSGLARGIDGHAHFGALQCGGRTIAVLGNGLGSVYPLEHEELAGQIASAGAVLSEFPMDAQPAPENFPRRNRIVAGLSLGVLVIEAGKKSGALISARLATEYNREVFAVPGRVDQPQHTAGVHQLLRDSGAKLVTCLEDVLDEFGEVGSIMGATPQVGSADDDPTDSGESPATLGLNDLEREIWEVVRDGTEEIDHIVSKARSSVSRVTPALTALQLKGLVSRLPGNRFVPRSAGVRS